MGVHIRIYPKPTLILSVLETIRWYYLELKGFLNIFFVFTISRNFVSTADGFIITGADLFL
jgi:hypothetical protein